jgi:serine/threonine-protein kinase
MAKAALPVPTVTGQPRQQTVSTLQQTPAPAPTPKGNDYTGLQLSQAIQKLAQGRQQAVVVYVTSSRPAGVVVASSRAGSRERLDVSAGPNPGALTSVPDVTGEDATTAQQDLEAAGFTVVQASWPVSDSSQDGLVVAESPAGGRQVPNGAAVVVYLGSATS